MAALETPEVNRGWKAPDFSLKGTDGALWTLDKAKGPNGLLVMFICNHCPFVKAILDKLVRDTAALREHGVHTIAIMSNDADDYPEDSFDNMRALAEARQFSFPYVIDETQEVAKGYGAVCTPDFFGFNAELELHYRGRLDGAGLSTGYEGPRELFDAMKQIAETGQGPEKQQASIGCSIKWRSNQAA